MQVFNLLWHFFIIRSGRISLYLSSSDGSERVGLCSTVSAKLSGNLIGIYFDSANRSTSQLILAFAQNVGNAKRDNQASLRKVLILSRTLFTASFTSLLRRE